MTLESIGIGTMVAILGILLYPIFYLITGSTAIGYIVMLTCVSIDGLIAIFQDFESINSFIPSILSSYSYYFKKDGTPCQLARAIFFA